MDFRCYDVAVRDDDGEEIYSGPRFYRCVVPDCRKLITNGWIASGNPCICGGRRLSPATNLSDQEKDSLEKGFYVLLDWEQELLEKGVVA